MKDANEINHTIHEFMKPGECYHEVRWHTGEQDPALAGRYVCRTCNKSHGYAFYSPNYTSNSSPRSLLNEVLKKAVAEFGREKMTRAIIASVRFKEQAVLPLDFTTASAEQIATAIVRCIEDGTEEGK
jgi:hypothetical protein